MKSLKEQLDFYHHYHTKRVTKITHFIGVPLIVLSLMMALNWLDFGIHGGPHVSAMWLAVLLLSIYYILLDWRLALGMVVVFILLGILATLTTGNRATWHGGMIALTLFIVGWIAQLIGHYFEGKKPALMDNLFQIFIAPIFLLAEIIPPHRH